MRPTEPNSGNIYAAHGGWEDEMQNALAHATQTFAQTAVPCASK